MLEYLLKAQIMILILGIVGSFDEVYYHNIKCNLTERDECFYESILHALRSIVYVFSFFAIGNFQMKGGYAIAMLAVMGVDAVVGVLDIWEEPKSRAAQGGLPRGEYFLHMMLSFGLGFLYYFMMSYLLDNVSQPTELTLITKDWTLIRLTLTSFAIGSLLFSIRGVYKLILIAKNR